MKECCVVVGLRLTIGCRCGANVGCILRVALEIDIENSKMRICAVFRGRK